MKADKDTLVIQDMISRGEIPSEGWFEITESLLDDFVVTYGRLHSKAGIGLTKKNEIRFAKKLAGLSLLKLLDGREMVVKSTRKNRSSAGFIYVVTNPAFPDHFKIGMTKDMKYRLNTYQTGDPFRLYKVEMSRFFEDVKSKEKEILEEFQIHLEKGEWMDKKVLSSLVEKFF